MSLAKFKESEIVLYDTAPNIRERRLDLVKRALERMEAVARSVAIVEKILAREAQIARYGDGRLAKCLHKDHVRRLASLDPDDLALARKLADRVLAKRTDTTREVLVELNAIADDVQAGDRALDRLEFRSDWRWATATPRGLQ